jgi:hypothetical protein
MNTETNSAHSFTEGADVPLTVCGVVVHDGAKEAWEKKSDIYGVPDHPYSEGFMDAIDLYQASLKKMVESRKQHYLDIQANPISEQQIPESNAFYGRKIAELDWILQQIDTAMPPSK